MASPQWSVVTGASGGLGEAFCERLAALGQNVVLTGRDHERLETLATRLERQYLVETQTLVADLSEQSGRDEVTTELARLEIDTLVNNAGFGLIGELALADPDQTAALVQVNCTALTAVTRALLPAMLLRGRGAIINVASTAAFQPMPAMAAYAASKAFVLSFSEALWSELVGSGVRVTAICPGPTQTAFFARAGDDHVLTSRRRPSQVVDTAFTALKTNKPLAVDGRLNRIMACVARHAPLRMTMSAASSATRRPRRIGAR